MSEEPSSRTLERLRARKERHAARSRFYRALFALAGFGVVVLGLLLIPLPGPGLLIVAVGLGMLALEFAWAERLLERTLGRMESAKQTAVEARPWQMALGALVVAACAASGLAIVLLWDVPLLPF